MVGAAKAAPNRSKGAGQLVMLQIALVGLGAGAAAALLFASVVSASWLSIVLFYVAPLPILIAALGWSHWAALIAAFSAAAALWLAFGGIFFTAFLASVGLPAWWLGYLSMLARPAANGSGALEWYPAGRLVVWAALLAVLVVIVAMLNFGSDLESFRAGLSRSLERMFRTSDEGNRSKIIEFFVFALPPAAAVLATITNVFNLWLAARVVKFSGRLNRPWPDLPAMEFPRWAPAVLGLVVLLSFLGGMIGLLAGVASASLLIAYGILGLAVMHTVTRNLASRGLVLGGVYGAVIIFGWPILALCTLGLAETAFDLRRRFAQRRARPPGT